MSIRQPKHLLGALAIGLAAWVTAALADGATPPEIRADAIAAHLEFLADDLLQGRKAGTAGYDIAARYVAAQYRILGLAPGGDDGSYLQAVGLRTSTLIADSLSIQATRGDQVFDLALLDDLLLLADSARPESRLSAPLVFVGWGISAPELGHDDYAEVDVAGKVVVVMSGAPDSFPGDQLAHYGGRTTKRSTAAARGAVGYLRVSTRSNEERRPWERSKRFAGRPSLTWHSEHQTGRPYSDLQLVAYLNQATFGRLLEGSGVELEALLDGFEEGGEPHPPFELGVTLTGEYRTEHEDIVSHNVAGILPGTDPELADEYVVFSYHLDHVGVREPRPPAPEASSGEGAASDEAASNPPDATAKALETAGPATASSGEDQAGESEGGDAEPKDTIYNGAYDNAMGAALTLEVARALTRLEAPNRRSILFLAVTAEESGLLGSDYFTHYPTVDLDKIVANVNIDMPLFLTSIGDVVAFGADHSNLEEVVRRAAAATGLEMIPDPMPEERLFVRSDQYSFVKKGIPAIYLVTGSRSLDPEVDGATLFAEFLKNHYHDPSDDTSRPVDWESAVRFAEANLRIGLEIANAAERPRWNEGDFFGDSFARAPVAAAAAQAESAP